MSKTCEHCGAVNLSTVYSKCYRCEKPLPKDGKVYPPTGMQPDGRTLVPQSDENSP